MVVVVVVVVVVAVTVGTYKKNRTHRIPNVIHSYCAIHKKTHTYDWQWYS